MTAALVLLPGDLSIAVREMREADRPYILSSWTRHVEHWLAHVVGGCDPINAHVNRRCEKLLARYGALVAVNPECDEQLLGWACLHLQRNVAHYVHVLEPFRRQGVASVLCAALHEPIIASHWSADAEWLQARHAIRYNPTQAR